jgi:hypothetical protein
MVKFRSQTNILIVNGVSSRTSFEPLINVIGKLKIQDAYGDALKKLGHKLDETILLFL